MVDFLSLERVGLRVSSGFAVHFLKGLAVEMVGPPKSKRERIHNGYGISMVGRDPPPAHSTRLALLGVCFLGLSIAALWIDHPLSALSVADKLPDFVEELCNAAEPFGDGLTAVLLLVVLARLVRPVRPYLPRVAAITFGAGLVVNIIKRLIPRFRPRHFDFNLSVWESFGAVVGPDGRLGTIESFPSGHAATAFGLAIGLSWLWPEGRTAFWILAILVGLQRVETGAHFLSDVLAGAAVSCFVGAAFLSDRVLGRPFARLEEYLRERWAADLGSPSKDASKDCSSPVAHEAHT